jgi:hypothetical protein
MYCPRITDVYCPRITDVYYPRITDVNVLPTDYRCKYTAHTSQMYTAHGLQV